MKKFNPPNTYNIKLIIDSWNSPKNWRQHQNTKEYISWMRSDNKRKITVIKKGKLWSVFGLYEKEGEWNATVLASEHTRDDAIKEAKRIMESIERHSP